MTHDCWSAQGTRVRSSKGGRRGKVSSKSSEVQSRCGGTNWLLWVACSVSSRRLGRSDKSNSRPLVVARSETVVLERGRRLSSERLVVTFCSQGRAIK